MIVLAIVLAAVFAFLWFLPLYRKAAGPDRVRTKPLVTAFLLAFFVTFAVGIAFQGLLGFIYRWAGVADESLVRHFLKAFISYALVEEAIKLLTGLIVLKVFKIRGAKNYILVFGMIGIGFELIETFLYTLDAGILASIFRSIFALHIFCQIWMGIYVYRAHKCKELSDDGGAKRNMALAFFVPVLIHGIHDASSAAAGLGEGHGTAGQVIMAIILLGCLAMDAVFAILTFKKAMEEIVIIED